MSNKGDFRTGPATPGMLNGIQIFNNMQTKQQKTFEKYLYIAKLNTYNPVGNNLTS